MKSTRRVTRFKSWIALFALFAAAGCGSQSAPPSSLSKSPSAPPGVEARIFVGNEDGTVSVIEHGPGGNNVVQTIPVGTGSTGDMIATGHNHVFVNVTDNNLVAVLDPIGGQVTGKNDVGAGTRPVHAYLDPLDRNKIWVLNDGDANGNDPLHCGVSGASVTVIQNHGDGAEEENAGAGGAALATICVGRGHHKAAFSFPSEGRPDIPKRAFVSNIKDGTVSVIGNDPTDMATYLKVAGTIDLCNSSGEAKKGKPPCDADLGTSNSASPHGLDYSPVSGMVYNSDVGYGMVAVIDPTTNGVTTTLDIGFANKAHVTPDGRFLIVKGTDTGSDPNHVIGKLTVIDVQTNTQVSQIDFPDIHPDSFEFTPDGKKLYVVSATSGSGAQKANLKNNVVLAFDSSGLPTLPSPKEITVGVADGGHRAITIHEEEGKAEHVIVPNPGEDTVSFIDVATDTVVDTVVVGDEPGAVLVFPLEGDLSHSH